MRKKTQGAPIRNERTFMSTKNAWENVGGPLVGKRKLGGSSDWQKKEKKNITWKNLVGATGVSNSP